MNGHEQHGEPVDSRPFFVIPYALPSPGNPGDAGDRPLPAGVVPWMCPAIHASAYAPGSDLTVRIGVVNRGGANTPSLAQVIVWWADPTTGFVVKPQNMIGFDLLEVGPRGGHATTKEMTKRIPADASNHVCLLARVSHQFDTAGTAPDPVGDRHWAQRNLAVAAAPPGAPIVFRFLAGNPLAAAADFTLLLERSPEDALALIADEVRADPSIVDARLAIAEHPDQLAEGAESRMDIVLEAGEQRELYVGIDIGDGVEPGRFASYEVSQRQGPHGPMTGSVGIVATGG